VLRVDEKNMREYNVLNCCGPIYTTNKKDSIYLPADDRRTYVAWSNLVKEDFTKEFWDATWQWYADGGYGHVAAYLASLDISAFNPKAPPPQTAVFWEIVNLNRAPEDDELADAIDNLAERRDENGNPIRPDAITIKKITDALPTDRNDFYTWLTDRRNRRAIPHCGATIWMRTASGDQNVKWRPIARLMIFSGLSVRKHFFARRDMRRGGGVRRSICGHNGHGSEKASP
jgi:hypothetical protein